MLSSPSLAKKRLFTSAGEEPLQFRVSLGAGGRTRRDIRRLGAARTSPMVCCSWRRRGELRGCAHDLAHNRQLEPCGIRGVSTRSLGLLHQHWGRALDITDLCRSVGCLYLLSSLRCPRCGVSQVVRNRYLEQRTPSARFYDVLQGTPVLDSRASDLPVSSARSISIRRRWGHCWGHLEGACCTVT